jgi:hypothetical protein
LWSSLTGRHHSMQAFLVVTYEFNASTTTSVMNSLLLPMEVESPMGISNVNFQRSDRELFVQEPNPVLTRLACFVFWQASLNETGLNARLGTGAFVGYTNTGSGFNCGNKGLMIRNDAPTGLTFTRGRNKLQMDIYNTSTTQRGGNVGSFWIVNYTSDVASSGIGSHNHTVLYPIYTNDTGGVVQEKYTSSGAVPIPETNYFITSVGLVAKAMIGAVSQGLSIKVERLVAEGGLIFESGYKDIGQHDGEMGLYQVYATVRSLFKRWTGDADASRLDLETSRRYILSSSNGNAFWNELTVMLTYHSITYTVAGNITDSNGGTVELSLHRENTGEKILETSRTGDGAYSFTWYDNTENVYVDAFEDEDYNKRSAPGLAS